MQWALAINFGIYRVEKSRIELSEIQEPSFRIRYRVTSACECSLSSADREAQSLNRVRNMAQPALGPRSFVVKCCRGV